MSNALYHTPEGAQITLSAAVRDGRVQVAVTDSGEGITPKDLPHVFDRFYRGDSSRSRAHGGAGLGLAIAKAWVQALGGEIGVESSPGHGSRFWFTLALA
jgi:signal transduction histidine kinase